MGMLGLEEVMKLHGPTADKLRQPRPPASLFLDWAPISTTKHRRSL
jgi:hypothetical protein